MNKKDWLKTMSFEKEKIYQWWYGYTPHKEFNDKKRSHFQSHAYEIIPESILWVSIDDEAKIDEIENVFQDRMRQWKTMKDVNPGVAFDPNRNKGLVSFDFYLEAKKRTISELKEFFDFILKCEKEGNKA